MIPYIHEVLFNTRDSELLRFFSCTKGNISLNEKNVAIYKSVEGHPENE